MYYIGELSWPLGAQELSYPESLDKYKLFGQFLLQGKVHVAVDWGWVLEWLCIIYCADIGDSKAGTVCSLPFNHSSNHDEKMVKVSWI